MSHLFDVRKITPSISNLFYLPSNQLQGQAFNQTKDPLICTIPLKQIEASRTISVARLRGFTPNGAQNPLISGGRILRVLTPACNFNGKGD